MSGLLKMSLLIALIALPAASARWPTRVLIQRLMVIFVSYWIIAIYIIPRLG